MKPILLAAMGLATLLLALPAVTLELGAVLGAGHSQATRMAAMREGRPTVGLSTDSLKRVLDTCNDVIDDPRAFDDGEAARTQIVDHCRAQIEVARRRAPADGFVDWAQAALAMNTGEFDTAFAALERSRDTAPFELWIALRRDDIDQRLWSLQTEARMKQHDEDLLVLAYSRRGVRGLARRYTFDPEFRERIVDIVEDLPVENQRRFLSNVRQIVREMRATQPLAGQGNG